MMAKEIEILVNDGCTRKEAERHLASGTVVFEEKDFRTHFSGYMDEWGIEDEDRQPYKEMLEKKKPMTDWGAVEYDGEWYFIAYVL